ncbi:MAG: hypothetical protein OQL20_00415 [Sedimenticola sp.]|nr:hypothetical protein [Sedimenticola sp.]
MVQSVLGAGSGRGFGHFRPLDGGEESARINKQRDRYTAGSDAEFRAYSPKPVTPAVPYRFKGSSAETRKRYSMPRETVNTIRPRFNQRKEPSGSVEWRSAPPVPPDPPVFIGKPVKIPEQVYPGYRFRPQEKTDTKTKR